MVLGGDCAGQRRICWNTDVLSSSRLYPMMTPSQCRLSGACAALQVRRPSCDSRRHHAMFHSPPRPGTLLHMLPMNWTHPALPW
jgi:hypothetical protein